MRISTIMRDQKALITVNLILEKNILTNKTDDMEKENSKKTRNQILHIP